MTTKQISWAKTHDWFLAVLADGEGVMVLDRWVDRDGNYFVDTKAFTDYYRLRNWAGY
jgi:hypothetical protein